MGERKKDADSDRLRPLRIPLPLEDALRGAMQVPPPDQEDEADEEEEPEEDEESPGSGVGSRLR